MCVCGVEESRIWREKCGWGCRDEERETWGVSIFRSFSATRGTHRTRNKKITVSCRVPSFSFSILTTSVSGSSFTKQNSHCQSLGISVCSDSGLFVPAEDKCNWSKHRYYLDYYVLWKEFNITTISYDPHCVFPQTWAEQSELESEMFKHSIDWFLKLFLMFVSAWWS